MKTARFLLACVAASLLAACSADGITAPAAPARPHFDEDTGIGTGDGSSTSDASSTGTANCIRVIVVNPDGSISMVCQVTANGQMGTGT
jgi:hypothetical protein